MNNVIPIQSKGEPTFQLRLLEISDKSISGIEKIAKVDAPFRLRFGNGETDYIDVHSQREMEVFAQGMRAVYKFQAPDLPLPLTVEAMQK